LDEREAHHEKQTTWIVSRKSDTIFGQGTIPEPSTTHIGKGVALDAEIAALVYIYARISQRAEMTLSFYVTHEVHTHEMHAHEMHAHEGFCEDLAR
jgi:hypothetical protein